MKDKKLQVFVSSTYTDLKEERQAAVEAILSSGHIPAGMELFSAGDESQMTVIERWIDESDIYLLILGGRYGSIDKVTGKSYTHLEYEYALKKGKPLFAVVINDAALDEKVKKFGRSVIEQDGALKLKEFKEVVLGHLVRFWDDKKDIKLAIHETISDFIYRKDLVGWIRGDNQINTGILAEEIARLTKENSELRGKINQFDNTTALYSNLTYDQLRELLVSHTITIDSNSQNLLTYLLDFGPELIDGMPARKPNEIALRDLARYKVTDHYDTVGQYKFYRFTEDGHNFYLRLLVQLVKKGD